MIGPSSRPLGRSKSLSSADFQTGNTIDGSRFDITSRTEWSSLADRFLVFPFADRAHQTIEEAIRRIASTPVQIMSLLAASHTDSRCDR